MKNLKSEILKDIISNKLVFVSDKEDKSDWIVEKNGSKIPIFFYTNYLHSYPDIMKKIINLTQSLISDKDLDFDRIVGVTYGGIQYAMWLAYELNKPCLCVRKEKKDYENRSRLMGIVNERDRCLLLEDATATGKTALSFTEILKGCGADVNFVISIVDINAGAKEALAKRGVKLYNLLTWEEIYEEYTKNNKVKNFVYEFIKGCKI